MSRFIIKPLRWTWTQDVGTPYDAPVHAPVPRIADPDLPRVGEIFIDKVGNVYTHIIKNGTHRYVKIGSGEDYTIESEVGDLLKSRTSLRELKEAGITGAVDVTSLDRQYVAALKNNGDVVYTNFSNVFTKEGEIGWRIGFSTTTTANRVFMCRTAEGVGFLVRYNDKSLKLFTINLDAEQSSDRPDFIENTNVTLPSADSLLQISEEGVFLVISGNDLKLLNLGKSFDRDVTSSIASGFSGFTFQNAISKAVQRYCYNVNNSPSISKKTAYYAYRQNGGSISVRKISTGNDGYSIYDFSISSSDAAEFFAIGCNSYINRKTIATIYEDGGICVNRKAIGADDESGNPFVVIDDTDYQATRKFSDELFENVSFSIIVGSTLTLVTVHDISNVTEVSKLRRDSIIPAHVPDSSKIYYLGMGYFASTNSGTIYFYNLPFIEDSADATSGNFSSSKIEVTGNDSALFTEITPTHDYKKNYDRQILEEVNSSEAKINIKKTDNNSIELKSESGASSIEAKGTNSAFETLKIDNAPTKSYTAGVTTNATSEIMRFEETSSITTLNGAIATTELAKSNSSNNGGTIESSVSDSSSSTKLSNGDGKYINLETSLNNGVKETMVFGQTSALTNINGTSVDTEIRNGSTSTSGSIKSSVSATQAYSKISNGPNGYIELKTTENSGVSGTIESAIQSEFSIISGDNVGIIKVKNGDTSSFDLVSEDNGNFTRAAMYAKDNREARSIISTDDDSRYVVSYINDVSSSSNKYSLEQIRYDGFYIQSIASSSSADLSVQDIRNDHKILSSVSDNFATITTNSGFGNVTIRTTHVGTTAYREAGIDISANRPNSNQEYSIISKVTDNDRTAVMHLKSKASDTLFGTIDLYTYATVGSPNPHSESSITLNRTYFGSVSTTTINAYSTIIDSNQGSQTFINASQFRTSLTSGTLSATGFIDNSRLGLFRQTGTGRYNEINLNTIESYNTNNYYTPLISIDSKVSYGSTGGIPTNTFTIAPGSKAKDSEYMTFMWHHKSSEDATHPHIEAYAGMKANRFGMQFVGSGSTSEIYVANDDIYLLTRNGGGTVGCICINSEKVTVYNDNITMLNFGENDFSVTTPNSSLMSATWKQIIQGSSGVSGSAGSNSKFIYMQNGEFKARTGSLGSSTKHIYINGSGELSASSGSVGTKYWPMFLQNGEMKPCIGILPLVLTLNINMPTSSRESANGRIGWQTDCAAQNPDFGSLVGVLAYMTIHINGVQVVSTNNSSRTFMSVPVFDDPSRIKNVTGFVDNRYKNTYMARINGGFSVNISNLAIFEQYAATGKDGAWVSDSSLQEQLRTYLELQTPMKIQINIWAGQGDRDTIALSALIPTAGCRDFEYLSPLESTWLYARRKEVSNYSQNSTNYKRIVNDKYGSVGIIHEQYYVGKDLDRVQF